MVYWYIALLSAGIAFLVTFVAGATDSWPRGWSKRKKQTTVPADYAFWVVMTMVLVSIVNGILSVADHNGGWVLIMALLTVLLIPAGGSLGRHFPIAPFWYWKK